MEQQATKVGESASSSMSQWNLSSLPKATSARCPFCAGVILKNLRLAYEEGTTVGGMAGLFGGEGGTAFYGAVVGKTWKMSLLAKRLAPPGKQPVLWPFLLVLLGIAIAFANFPIGIAVSLGSMILWAIVANKGNKHHDEELKNWSQFLQGAFICMSCGSMSRFTQDQPSTVGVAPK